MLKELLSPFKPFDEFTYWFERSAVTNQEFFILMKDEEYRPIGVLNEVTKQIIFEGDAEHDQALVENDFENYMTRPEYLVGSIIASVETDDEATLKNTYAALIAGIAMIRARRAGKNPDASIESANSCVNWLSSTDFFIAPGSSVYHDSEPCGLVRHSLRVYNNGIVTKAHPAFRGIEFDRIALVALVHDWCKIGLYETYMKNVKNEETGAWEKVPAYRKVPKGVPLGHGVSSMFLASKFFRLAVDEVLAIRWHMGVWNLADNEMDELQRSNEDYPLVHLIQFADCLSITNYPTY